MNIFVFLKIASSWAERISQTENNCTNFPYLTNLFNFDATEHVNLFLWQVVKWG